PLTQAARRPPQVGGRRTVSLDRFMGRAPCCEKDGLKRGAWSPEEDQRLADYIAQHGHSNWRALPKHAGEFRILLTPTMDSLSRGL
uniref:Uncharacterized protein n=1 Tax=Aegilops tauschii subsp. strangulata TaxID=200361 RepID=A0A452YG34_AEGTS